MPVLAPNLYEQWIAPERRRLLMQEPGSAYPPERVLQTIWHHQRLRRENLCGTDGRRIKVLHPGFLNHAPGPDFRGAVIQFGDDPPQTGDVEIDWEKRNWSRHGHLNNPDFAQVILHVIWRDEAKTADNLPTLVLESCIDKPLPELEQWAGGMAPGAWPETSRGACSSPLSKLPPAMTEELLHQAAAVRFQRKAGELEGRAREAGWEQALWEGLFRALGYSQNVWPMQRLGELRLVLSEGVMTVLSWQARLLGVAGFLGETEIKQPSYLRVLWDQWWRDRDKFSELILPKTVWRMAGLRPANQPQRRLALAAHWLARADFIKDLEKWFLTASDPGSLLPTLHTCLQPGQDEFWESHWTFRAQPMAAPQPILGESRTTDLAINVILPWFWARARAGKDEALMGEAENRYRRWPAAQDNNRLRMARQRLLGRPLKRTTGTAALQQGFLQIMRDFCDHSNALCSGCSFPARVGQLLEHVVPA